MNPSHLNRSPSARPRPPTMASLSSLGRSAASSIKTTLNNVASSVATVQANRSVNGPGETSFLSQVLDQLSLDKAQRREGEIKGQPKLAVFPGWAVRRFPNSQNVSREDVQFDVDVFVSGYASSFGPPEHASRSQRALMKIVKVLASLPKVPSNESQTNLPGNQPPSQSTEDLLKLASLPPRPDEMTRGIEAQLLTNHAQHASAPLEAPRPSFLSGSDKIDGPKSEPPINLPDEDHLPGLYNLNIGSSSSLSSTGTITSTDPQGSIDVGIAEMTPSELLKLHENFDSRLQPFWSSVVTEGTVCVSLYPSTSNGQADRRHGAIATAQLPLSDQGYFRHVFRISYESLCTHPGGLRIASGDPLMEHSVVATAELLSPPPQAETTHIVRQLSVSSAPPAQSQLNYVAPSAQMTIPLGDARVRVISDIDDTIKISDILHGPRAAFRNLFVRNLDELAVPGMSEWYTSLSRRGVRFHYVSNSPFELLPVLSEFFRVTGLPPGSLKLKYYRRKTLLKALLEPAGERKRAGVIEVMEQFPESKFLLVGDSGERDLELYASLANDFARRGRHQILGIFIRDVTSQSDTLDPNRQQFPSRPPSPVSSIYGVSSESPSIDSAGSSSYFSPNTPQHTSMDQSRSPSHDTKEPRYSSSADDKSVHPVFPAPQDPGPTIRPHHQQPQPHRTVSFPLPLSRSLSRGLGALAGTRIGSLISPIIESSAESLRPTLEKQRAEQLKMRIARARNEIPPGVMFRVFQNPEECFSEVEDILSKHGVNPPDTHSTGSFSHDVDAS